MGITKQNSMVFAIFVLFSALCISGVAAYYSIVGLMALFSGAAFAIAIMGGVLEVGKLVTASWLYNNWKTSPFFLKSYLTIAVVVLMFITSMGIFGFLSKAHLAQTGPSGDVSAKIEKIDFDINQQQKRIDRANKILNQFDAALEKYFENDFVTRGLKEREKQTEEREVLQVEIENATKKIDELSAKKFEEQKELRGIEAEVGPIKYVAEFIYGEDEAKSHVDKAVRLVILILIFVFDPLAVLLVVAGNMSIAMAKIDRPNEKPNNNKKKVETPSPPPPPPPTAPASPPPVESPVMEEQPLPSTPSPTPPPTASDKQATSIKEEEEKEGDHTFLTNWQEESKKNLKNSAAKDLQVVVVEETEMPQPYWKDDDVEIDVEDDVEVGQSPFKRGLLDDIEEAFRTALKKTNFNFDPASTEALMRTFRKASKSKLKLD